MLARLRKVLFWLHFTLGMLVGLAVIPTAVTGALLSFEREITAWVEADKQVVDPGTPPLLPGELLARVAPELPAPAKPNTVQLYRERTAPALVVTKVGSFLVNPYDGRLLGRSGVRRVFGAAEDFHRSVGLVFAGAKEAGNTLAGLIAIGILSLSLSGPWLWWPRQVNRKPLRRRLWFMRTNTPAARNFAWHHVVGIWCTPVLLVASCTGIFLCFDGAKDAVTSVLGKAPKPHLSIDADTAVREATVLAPQWTALRIRWNDRRNPTIRIQLGRGIRPTQFAMLDSGPPDAAGVSHVILRRYEDGRAGDKFLGWARWLHTGQALGRIGQAAWGIGVVGILVLVWTGLSLGLRRVRQKLSRTPPAASAD